MGLGAALLIAALLLSTYTKGKIAKIPLDLDATLVADGTGTAFDPESLNTDRFVINRSVPVVLQEQLSVESPSNAEVVTLQVGSTLRRTDKQQDAGLLLALVDTVTVNRKSATAVSSESNPGGAVQKPRAVEDTLPPTNIALPHDGLAYRFPTVTELYQAVTIGTTLVEDRICAAQLESAIATVMGLLPEQVRVR